MYKNSYLRDLQILYSQMHDHQTTNWWYESWGAIASFYFEFKIVTLLSIINYIEWLN